MHVFISYARADGAAFAGWLEQALTQAGLRTWRDVRDLDVYQDFSAEIEEAIENAGHVVVCLTPSIAERKDSFVRREILYSQGCNVPLTPVLGVGYPPGRVPILVNHLTWLSFTREGSIEEPDYERGLARLLARLQTPASPAMAAAAAPPDDAARAYCRVRYQRVSSFLQSTVFTLLTLAARGAEGAVAARRLPLALSAAQLPGLPPTTAPTFEHIGAAFDAAQGQLLLLGEPGAGKTTTLMAFAREALARHIEDTATPLPLMGRIANWPAAGEPALADWLAAESGCEVTLVRRALDEGRALLLLDGLDELAPDAGRPPRDVPQDARWRFLDLLEPALGANQVLLTCRRAEYAGLGRQVALGAAAVLRPLDDAQLAAYVAQRPALAAALARTPALAPMLGTPLLLSMMTYALEGAPAPAAGTEVLDLRDQVFRRYVERRFAHEAERAGTSMRFDLPALYRVLGQAAVCSVDFDHSWSTHDGQPLAHTIATELGDAAGDFIAQALRLHLLVRDERGTLRFAHLLLRDHFGVAALEAGLRHHQAFAFLATTDDPRATPMALQEIRPDGTLSLSVLQNFPLRHPALVLAAARLLSSEAHYSRDDLVRDLAEEVIGSTLLPLRPPAMLALARALREGAGGHERDFHRALRLLAGTTPATAIAWPPDADPADLATVHAVLAAPDRS